MSKRQTPSKIAISLIQEAHESQASELDLSGLGLRDVPREIAKLKSLVRLILSDNQIRSLPHEIGSLENLQELWANDNRISLISPAIGLLKKLKIFSLRENIIEILPSEIGSLPNLSCLWLQANRLRALPPEIGNLGGLQSLWIHKNKLTYLPDSFQFLEKLVNLDAGWNRLERLPSKIGNPANLRNLNLQGNPLPATILSLSEHSAEALSSYLENLEFATDSLAEYKVLFLGEPNVGKSSLVSALRREDFIVDRPATHGLEIKTLDTYDANIGQPVRFNLWDFGGQKIYRNAQEIFISKQSLHIVIWRPREGLERNEVSRWIERIRLRAGDDVHVLLVSTYSDSDGSSDLLEAQLKSLRSKYPGLSLDHIAIDSKTRTGLRKLTAKMLEVVPHLPRADERLNPLWKRARVEIAQDPRSCMPVCDFYDICNSHGLRTSEAESLAKILHDAGHVLYFPGEMGVRDFIVTNPAWIVNMVGLLVNGPEIIKSSGVVESDCLLELFCLAAKQKLENDEFFFVVSMLRRFNIVLPWTNGSYLVCDMIPSDRPASLSFDSGGSPEIKLQWVLDADPTGLMIRIISFTSRFSTKRHWSGGVFLADEWGSTALIEYNSRLLSVTVKGGFPTYFVGVLHEMLTQVLMLWPGLSTRLMVPYAHSKEEGNLCRHRIKIEVLRERIRRGKESFTCGECGQDVNGIVGLLAPVDFSSKTAQQRLSRLDDTTAYGTGSVENVHVAHLFSVIMKALSSEARHCPRLFTLVAAEKSGYMKSVRSKLRLTLWCEFEGCQHPISPIGSGGPGEYLLESYSQWIKDLAPYASVIAKSLRLALPFLPMDSDFFQSEHQNAIEEVITSMEELLGEIATSGSCGSSGRLEGSASVAVGAGHRALRAILEQADPLRTYGQLEPLLCWEKGEYIWVCREHRAVMEGWQSARAHSPLKLAIDQAAASDHETPP